MNADTRALVRGAPGRIAAALVLSERMPLIVALSEVAATHEQGGASAHGGCTSCLLGSAAVSLFQRDRSTGLALLALASVADELTPPN